MAIRRLVTVTSPVTTRLISLSRVRRSLRIEYPDDDDVLLDMIDEATDIVQEYLLYPLARGVYTEYVPGFGTQRLMLSRVPIVAVSQVLDDGTLVASTAYQIESPAAMGSIYKTTGWLWTGSQTDLLTPLPGGGSEEPSFQVDYTAGYLLEGDNVSRAATISMASADNSYNDSAAGFPLLVAGDRVRVAGANTAANNGWKTVVSRTASKIVVAESLATESAGAPVSLDVVTLPMAIRRACLDVVRALYQQRQWEMTGPRVVQTEGGTQIFNAPSGKMPQSAQDALLSFMRVEVL
jgi:hypothetical protein